MCFTPDVVSSIPDLAGMAAAGITEEYNCILGYCNRFFRISNAGLPFYSEAIGDFPQSHNL